MLSIARGKRRKVHCVFSCPELRHDDAGFAVERTAGPPAYGRRDIIPARESTRSGIDPSLEVKQASSDCSAAAAEESSFP
jgi:hypothetical protein